MTEKKNMVQYNGVMSVFKRKELIEIVKNK